MKRLQEKMEEAGVRNCSAYVRKMALDGSVVRLYMSDIRKLVKLLRISSNNLNQVAKMANTTGSIYGSDMQVKQDEIWENGMRFCLPYG